MWESLLNLVFSWIAWFNNLVGDWGLAIIIFTLIFRAIIFPISFKQQKSTHVISKLQGRLKEIQTKYQGDQQKIAEETQALYREAHFNPLTGCLPFLLQMPFFILLFQVLRSISDRVEEGTVVSFYNLVPDLTSSAIQTFTGSGLVQSIPYFILVLIFAASLIVPTLLNRQNTDGNTVFMMVIMACFMAYIGAISPAGVTLYWDISSIIGVLTQIIMSRYYKKKDAEEEALITPIKIDVERKKKKPRPTKKAKY